MPINDYIDLSAQPELDFNLIEAYGCREAPCLSEEVTINRATEYVLRVNGYNRRVYNFEQTGRDGRMYVLQGNGKRFFLPEEAVTMLTYGSPYYGVLTPVAHSVTVAA